MSGMNSSNDREEALYSISLLAAFADGGKGEGLPQIQQQAATLDYQKVFAMVRGRV